jgi:peptidoglycan hydrolase CwlO-like protein
MLLEENKEYEGVVVDNVDPLGKSRLRVFVFGYHDLTGTRTKVEHLPWAFSGQLQSFQSVPVIGSIVKVKFNFSHQQNTTWYPTSQHTKTGDKVKSPLPFLVYNPETEKFINSFNAYNDQKQSALDSQIQELENQKLEFQSQLQELKNQLQSINDEAQNVDDPIEIELLNNERRTLETSIDQLYEAESRERQSFQDRILSEKKLAQFNWNNFTTSSSDGRVPSGENNSFATYAEYEQFYTSSTQSRFNEVINQISTSRSELVQRSNSLAEQVQNNKLKSVNLNDNSKSTQTEIDVKSKQISEIDLKINTLRGSTASSTIATTTGENLQELNSQISRVDKTTGKVYTNINGEEKLIGVWTGLYYYTPGFNGQPGTPIYDRPTNEFIKEESYLVASDIYAAKRGNTTSNHPSQNPAIQASNNDKTWNCDISYETRMKILTKRKNVMMAVKWLRDKIASYFTGLSDSAISQWVEAAVKQITAVLKSIQKFLKFVNDVVLEIAKLTAEIRQLITYILSLPVTLLVLIQDCITHFLNSISDAFSESISIGGDSPDLSFAEINNLVNQAQKTFSTASETLQATSIVYTEVKSIESTFQKV